MSNNTVKLDLTVGWLNQSAESLQNYHTNERRICRALAFVRSKLFCNEDHCREGLSEERTKEENKLLSYMRTFFFDSDSGVILEPLSRNDLICCGSEETRVMSVDLSIRSNLDNIVELEHRFWRGILGTQKSMSIGLSVLAEHDFVGMLHIVQEGKLFWRKRYWKIEFQNQSALSN